MYIFMPPTELRLHGPCNGNENMEPPHLHFYMKWDNSDVDEPDVIVMGYMTIATEEFHIDRELSEEATQHMQQEFEQNKIIARLARDTAQAIVDGRLRVPPEMVEMARSILEGEGTAEINEDSIGNILQHGIQAKEDRPKKEKELSTGMYL